jgi:uncharacterized protein YlxP (DUF503 family)
MNQVMINAVDLEMLVQEIKDLKVKIAELNKLLADERRRSRVLAEEVNWLDQGIKENILVVERETCASIVEQAGMDGLGTLAAAMLIRDRSKK